MPRTDFFNEYDKTRDYVVIPIANNEKIHLYLQVYYDPYTKRVKITRIQ